MGTSMIGFGLPFGYQSTTSLFWLAIAATMAAANFWVSEVLSATRFGAICWLLLWLVGLWLWHPWLSATGSFGSRILFGAAAMAAVDILCVNDPSVSLHILLMALPLHIALMALLAQAGTSILASSACGNEGLVMEDSNG